MLKFILKIPGKKWAFRKMYYPTKAKPVDLLGLHFPNRVGLAAGFDKDARFLHELQVLGFGFIEIGTITPKGQPGNPKPRLFRLPKDQALINRLGFNNQGLDAAIERLKDRPEGLIVGGNIGKNKVTPNEEAVNDYLICFKGLYPYVDYFTVNVSSPNTPGLRELQGKEALSEILNALIDARKENKIKKPILLKIAPDLSDGQIEDIIAICKETGIDGLIGTNTTISRDGLKTSNAEIEKIGAGGLSGKPVFEISTEVLKKLRAGLGKDFPIIGVGGIVDVQSAKAKLEAGADLIQIYTGFIYGGPGIVKRLAEA
jgi:dihydroorotate dehydrogenase